MAVHNYTSTAERPASVRPELRRMSASTWQAWPIGWSASLLPGLEQRAMYNATNLGLRAPGTTTELHDVQQVAAQRPRLPVRRPARTYWPSDTKRQLHGEPRWPVVGHDVVDRADRADEPPTPTAAKRRPDQRQLCLVRFESVLDGSSNTAMLSEKLVGARQLDYAPVDRSTSPSGSSSRPASTVNADAGNGRGAEFAQTCKSLPGTTRRT